MGGGTGSGAGGGGAGVPRPVGPGTGPCYTAAKGTPLHYVVRRDYCYI